jgi:hypothetical protein
MLSLIRKAGPIKVITLLFVLLSLSASISCQGQTMSSIEEAGHFINEIQKFAVLGLSRYNPLVEVDGSQNRLYLADANTLKIINCTSGIVLATIEATAGRAIERMVVDSPNSIWLESNNQSLFKVNAKTLSSQLISSDYDDFAVDSQRNRVYIATSAKSRLLTPSQGGQDYYDKIEVWSDLEEMSLIGRILIPESNLPVNVQSLKICLNNELDQLYVHWSYDGRTYVFEHASQASSALNKTLPKESSAASFMINNYRFPAQFHDNKIYTYLGSYGHGRGFVFDANTFDIIKEAESNFDVQGFISPNYETCGIYGNYLQMLIQIRDPLTDGILATSESLQFESGNLAIDSVNNRIYAANGDSQGNITIHVFELASSLQPSPKSDSSENAPFFILALVASIIVIVIVVAVMLLRKRLAVK